ncbi:hypothetical protein ATANTOWER_029821 [Ataeniobius toweri]|uniref:Uncharacterized protein n=1 Tax=Ataeniobius toweri TaxID=208326 RepID=A0ABU7A2Z3_9TELE|nr:hypothetical protein [Ataeniobius toweri]
MLQHILNSQNPATAHGAAASLVSQQPSHSCDIISLNPEKISREVTAVYWISIQFATCFPANFKYSRKPLQTSSWQLPGSSIKRPRS